MKWVVGNISFFMLFECMAFHIFFIYRLKFITASNQNFEKKLKFIIDAVRFGKWKKISQISTAYSCLLLFLCAAPRCPDTFPLAYTRYEGHHHLYQPSNPTPRLRVDDRTNVREQSVYSWRMQINRHPTSGSKQLNPESREKDPLK